ncbi:ubiquitination factor e4 [Holotrichia oblita]|uniref:Ubiquitination factor e4 n=1 Tax=Holotrichia oblita TaxID=644536 RepID=A0ACB9TTL1_HOLOL|nr:ubiquitination factor e4 [Holotrichia oblita]
MSNPFAALLEENTTPKKNQEVTKLCDTIENVFGFTLSKTRSEAKGLLYLEDQASTFPGQDLDLSILEHALFERLFINNVDNLNDFIHENRVIRYLFACYSNNLQTRDFNTCKSIKKLIMRNVLTSLKQPDLFSEQDVFAQFYDIIKNAELNSQLFFDDVYKSIAEEDEDFGEAKEVYTKFLQLVHMDMAKSTVLTFNVNILNVLIKFSNSENLALTLLDYCQVKNENVGIEYANTLLGALLSLSVLPKTVQGEYTFFPEPLDQPSNVAHEATIHTNTDKITHYVHMIILNMLKRSSSVKKRMLTWLGNCLKANVDRGKLWASQAMELSNIGPFNTVGDGMMINLLTVLMEFCQPFCSPDSEMKVLKVDPTYSAVKNEDCEARGVHLLDLGKETCLISSDADNSEESDRPTAASYSFVSECFYMGHKAFDLGYRVAVDKLIKLNQEMVRIERTYNDAISQSAGPNDIADAIKARMKMGMQKYLSVKAALANPSLIDAVFNFMSSTAIWMNQVAINGNFTEAGQVQYAPLRERECKFPLSESVPVTLKCIPEFIVENVVCYLFFLRRFSPKVFEMQGFTRLNPILTFILTYMSSPGRMKNPHLRARLAEALEALLPFHKDDPPQLNTLGGFQREMLFKAHVHRQQIVKSLLEVFVGIEMTGQSVQFEQKFNYRRPMYLVMDYLWELPEHQEYFRLLAEDAERNMEAVTPPLFLRFINLLMNDAVFLLDEALANMAKLKELQAARHLLSDQTDPFNRSPLTLDQVMPNKELAEEINKWLSERKASAK